MEPIIDPVSRELLEKELKPEFFVRETNNAGNLIYAVRAVDSPLLMREIGRLREIAFREAGGGTGKEADIDDDDLAPDGYVQLFVWDPSAKEIMGGYRYIVSTSPHPEHFSTEHYFRFSDKFRQEILPYTIELGRSFVQPIYQNTRGMKSLYALDNLWDGLGALVVMHPESKYFFGKVTMYGDYDRGARNILLYFLHKYFADNENLIEAIDPIDPGIDIPAMEKLFNGENYKEDYKILNGELKARGEFIPPMINSYMSLSPTMKVFSTVYNSDFGEVEETGILIKISDVYENKISRHTKGFFKKLFHRG